MTARPGGPPADLPLLGPVTLILLQGDHGVRGILNPDRKVIRLQPSSKSGFYAFSQISTSPDQLEIDNISLVLTLIKSDYINYF